MMKSRTVTEFSLLPQTENYHTNKKVSLVSDCKINLVRCDHISNCTSYTSTQVVQQFVEKNFRNE